MHPETLQPTVLEFQYNPHTVTRNFEIASGSGRSEVGQLTGQPVETIQFELVFDAADALEAGGDPGTVADHLAALVNVITPAVDDLVGVLQAADQGAFEVLPPASPITLLVLGARRVLPVAFTELSIAEEGHAADLTPTLARASVTARVLTLDELPPSHVGHALALANAAAQETRGQAATTQSLAGALGADRPLL